MYRVMIVDDEPIVLESLSSILPWEALECELVGTARNGMDAYNEICDFYPDIVITDIKMPVLNGLELIEKAKKLDKNIDFIVLSGYDDFAFAQTAMKFGVKYYHLKPARKEALIETLRKMVAELKAAEQLRLDQERQLNASLKLPLQKSFLFDAFSQSPLSDETLLRYARLLGFPESAISCCLCTFLEEKNLSRFRTELDALLQRHSLPVLWPAFYVTNGLVFLYAASELQTEDKLREFILSRQYPGQTVSSECQFLHFDGICPALREIIRKISRYRTILLLNGLQEPEAVNSAPLSAQSLSCWADTLKGIPTEYEARRIANDVFASVTDVETAILLTIRLLFSSPLFADKEAFDYYTLQSLFRSASPEEVRHIATNLLLRQLPSPSDQDCPQNTTLIPRVKEYVESHLDSEALSLKWLAENKFFISVGYLSRQFQSEEGERFSIYLNRRRMELAKKLMSVYHNNNIQDIARQVGFRNNPRYFSQVFKKFTGMTPSEYLAALK